MLQHSFAARYECCSAAVWGAFALALGPTASAQREPFGPSADGVYEAARRGAIGTANVPAGDAREGDIFGPFEAGFAAGQQRSCQNHPAIPGGLDTMTAVDLLRATCPELPQDVLFAGNGCGGHTRDLHYHEYFTCLYGPGPGAGHSTRAADITHPDGTQGLYGKYEVAETLPREAGKPLDACNGHFGITPDSNGQAVYHYHVTDAPPFSVGCLGPATGDQLVTVAQCRAASRWCGGQADTQTLTVRPFGAPADVALRYDDDCSCWDAEGSNAFPFVELDLSSGPAPATPAPATPAPSPPPAPATPAPSPPPTSPGPAGKVQNVLLFMADDLPFVWDEEQPEIPAALQRRHGYDWSAVAGAMAAHKRVRAEGAVFTQAYTAAPKCAPARFGLMTGRLPSRGVWAQSRSSSGGRTTVSVPACKLSGIDLGRTLANRLGATGEFSSVQGGKWHIGTGTSFNDYPGAVAAVAAAGFDTAAAVYHGNMNGLDGLTFSHNNEWVVAESLGAVTEAVGAGRRFFAYLAPTGPHSPSNEDGLALPLWATPDPSTPVGIVPDSGMPSRQNLTERAEALLVRADDRKRDSIVGALGVDDALGAALDSLEAAGALDDTLVIVTMDHGTVAKDQLYEGGARVALMMRHPGTIAAGARYALPVSTLDVAPTVLDAVGIGAGNAGYELDGVSLWPMLASGADAAPARSCVLVEIEQSRAVVCGGVHKFISTDGVAVTGYPGSSGATEQYYNLANDPAEQANLLGVAEHAAKVQVLRSYIACHDVNTAPGGAMGSECKMADAEADVALVLNLVATTPSPTQAPTNLPSSAPTSATCKNVCSSKILRGRRGITPS